MAEHASTAAAARGTIIQLSTDGGTTYTAIGDLTDVGVPGFDTEILDVTHQESPKGIREKLGGLIDPGEISCTVRYTPGSTEYDAITTNAGKLLDWQITFPSPIPAYEFKGILKSWQPAAAGMSAILEGTLGIAVSGEFTKVVP